MSSDLTLDDIQLKNDLKRLLANAIGVGEETLTEQTSLIRDLGLDSLAILRIVSIIENRYEIELDEDQLDLMDNLSTAYRYVQHLLEMKR